MMMQAVLSNPSHPEYGVATIPFPIPCDQYAHCMELLEALEIGDALKADCKVEKIDSFFSVLKRTEMLTVNTTQFHIRPARPEEAGLFYTPHPEEDKRLGTVGHVRMDFGRSGNEFWHTWWPRGPEELNNPVFKAELQEVVDTLRESVLKSRFAMERFCYARGGKISGGWTQNYGYIVETEHYRYCLRCNPSPGDYNCYCTAYDLDVQRQNMARDKPLMGRVSYANGDAQEFTDADEFLRCVQEELPYRPTTGFRYEVLTDDPAVCKQVDDMIFDLYGEEAPCRQEDHEPQPEQGMTFGGM